MQSGGCNCRPIRYFFTASLNIRHQHSWGVNCGAIRLQATINSWRRAWLCVLVSVFLPHDALIYQLRFEYNPGDLDSHEVVIDVHYCGICHSDISVIDNDYVPHLALYVLFTTNNVRCFRL